MDKIIAALEAALAAARADQLTSLQISFKTPTGSYASLGFGDPIVLWGLAARMLEVCKAQAMHQSNTEVTMAYPNAN